MPYPQPDKTSSTSSPLIKKDCQRMIVDPMLMVVHNSRLFLTHNSLTAIIPNTGILCILVNQNHLRHIDTDEQIKKLSFDSCWCFDMFYYPHLFHTQQFLYKSHLYGRNCLDGYLTKKLGILLLLHVHIGDYSTTFQIFQ